jgi:Rrf2 family protein
VGGASSASAVAQEVAWHRHRPSVSVGEISTALDISFHFLTKILQQLTSANLTHSHRGPNGGIALARPASEISLYDIIVAVDGPGLFLDCLLRPGYCGENGTCTAHVVWEPIRKKFMDSAQRTTVAALAETTLHLNETPAETIGRHFKAVGLEDPSSLGDPGTRDRPPLEDQAKNGHVVAIG